MTKYNKLVISRISEFMSIVWFVCVFFRAKAIHNQKNRNKKKINQKYQTATQRKTSKVAEYNKQWYNMEEVNEWMNERTAQKSTPIDVDRSIAPHKRHSWICTQNANWFIHFPMPLQNTHIKFVFLLVVILSCRVKHCAQCAFNNLSANIINSKLTRKLQRKLRSFPFYLCACVCITTL